MSVSTRDKVHNQFCREPDAGKPHVRIYAGVRPVRGVSTHQVRSPFLLWEVLVIYIYIEVFQLIGTAVYIITSILHFFKHHCLFKRIF